jgi:radical SAM protein with 4Fe4S-binding SPASM domain
MMQRLWLELTQRCNLACRHCFARTDCSSLNCAGSERQADFWCDVISQAADLGCRDIELTGGEPLLRAEFPRVFLHAHTLGLRVSVTTNATLLSDAIAKLWQDAPPAKVKVSFYGWDTASYETVVQKPGVFGSFVDGITRLRKQGTPFKALVPAHPLLLHHLDELRSFATENGATLPLSVGWELMLHEDRVPERVSGIRSLRSTPVETARQKMAFSRLALRDFRVLLEERKQGTLPDDRLFCCIAAGDTLAVDAAGRLQPCRMLRAPSLSYDLTRYSLSKGVSQHMVTVRNHRIESEAGLRHCARCVLRAACSSCPATSWMEYGRLDVPVEFYCEIMHHEAYWLGLLPVGAKGWETRAVKAQREPNNRLQHYAGSASLHRRG